MEKEYSTEVRGKVHAYRFSEDEKAVIAKCLKPEINRLKKKIDKIINHPKNEGQATYADQIKILDYEITAIENIIDAFGFKKSS